MRVMMIRELMEKKGITTYRLSKNSGIHYTTVNDICNNKVSLAKCNSETVYRLSKALNISMEELLEPFVISRPNFELFKSNVCHSLKELGDIQFLIETIKNDEVNVYYKRCWYPECLYLLAMVDYISRLNDIPLCTNYNQIRQLKLKKKIYPMGVELADMVSDNEKMKMESELSAIPEFLRFNIIESEVRNVI